MPTSYSTLLGLALPVTGELSGTWGDEVNNYITQYLDSAVAGTQTISGSQTAVTLSRTTNAALAQAGTGATGSAQYSIINCTGNPASTLTVTVPSTSKVYLVLNNTSTNQSVVVKPSAAAGVTVSAARAALIAWNGTDFELVGTDDASRLNGVLAAVNGGTGQSSYTTGDTLFASSSTALSKLAIGASGRYLSSTGTAPQWSAPAALTKVDDTNVTLTLGGSPTTALLNAASITAGWTGQLSVSRGGTGASTLTGYVYGNGTGAFTASTSIPNSATTATSANTANTIVARDASGNFSAGTITATLSGNATNVTGTVAIANGGTGTTTQQAAINALAGAVTSGQYLRGNGTNVVMSAIQAADIPTLNQNTTGTASNVTGTVAVANGGTGATTAPNARTNLGATTVGGNLFTLTNPSAVTFPRFNADNTVSALDAATFRTAIGAGTGDVTAAGNNAFTGANTFYNATGQTFGTATSTQDGIILAGRAGGTSSYRVTLVPGALGASRTLTLPNISGTVAVSNASQTFTSAQAFAGNVYFTNGSVVNNVPVSDSILIAGPSTGSSGHTVSLTTGALSSSTTLTLPNVTSTLAVLGAAQTFTATQTFSGSTSTLGAVLTDTAETTTVSATAATGTIAYDVTTQSVLYYTSNASANWTVNFRGSSGTSLNTLLSTGQSVTVAFLVTQGSTAYYNNSIQIDGTTSGVTVRWLGGAPTAGNASGIDSYRYLIIKTGSATYTVLASVTQFKA
jgi:hypothetical protein